MLPSSINTSLSILRNWERIGGRSAWSMSQRESLPQVVEIFETQGVSWCLAGVHAVGFYTEPRATQDIVFIVDDRKLKRLLEALTSRFGELGLHEVGAAVRLTALSVDLIRASAHPLFRAALEQTVVVEKWRVPRIEVLIALKFLFATSAWRGANRKRQDAVDLVSLYEASDPDSLDRALLTRLAGLAYPGAERELNGLLAQVDRGELLTI